MKKNFFYKIIENILYYVKNNNFCGYGKYDALNSHILNFLSFNNKWLRLLFIQIVMRFPFNLRPLFFVKKTRNPKGIALFVKSFLLLYSLTKDKNHLQLATELLEWLLKNHSNKSKEFSGYCWGYNFIWQSPFFYAPKYYPNQTVTTFVGEAFILAYRILKKKKYLQIAESTAQYIMKDLPILYESKTEKCIGYVTGKNEKMVININSMAAAFLAKLYKETNKKEYKKESIKLINFVVNNRTKNYAWTYVTDISHSYVDNYHTTGIIEEIFEVMEELNYWRWKIILNKAINYYINNLLTKDLLPKWRNNKIYPIDIHSCASSIIMFSKLSRLNRKYLKYAENILNWTINNMYSKKGYFYYQKYKFFTKKFTLMRWCNAWMLYAISEFLIAKEMK